MFRSDGPFKDIPCPEVSQCKLLNCIFNHLQEPPKATIPNDLVDNAKGSISPTVHDAISSPPRKKQRFSPSSESSLVNSGSPKIPISSKDVPGVRSSRARVESLDLQNIPLSEVTDPREPTKNSVIYTQKREVSPPSLKTKRDLVSKDTSNAAKHTAENTSDGKVSKRKRIEPKRESLVPRIVPRPPATHSIRAKLLGLLHEQFVRLNEEVKASSDPWKDALCLSVQEMVTGALNEEEHAARAKAAVYANVMKLRIGALKKMKLEVWKNERIQQIEQETPQPKKAGLAVPLHTGLSSKEEIALLSTLVTSQEGLSKHGYVIDEPSAAEVEKSRKGLESAQGYEVCDRCNSRFQVFPGRREDGALTTGGECTYHPGRVRSPPKEGGRPPEPEKHTCCQQLPGSRGCKTAECHVFKVTDAKRLAHTLQFRRTPENSLKDETSAVCFDCEMGYTTNGMELIRLTATSWPGGEELLDVLVRPLGEILDLNSAFSGVWPQQFTEAVQYSATGSGDSPKTTGQLQIVESPAAARELLFSLVNPTTPLIGHALENDLNATRIIHPVIIDTVLLYPHPRGLPLRHGLKHLVKKHLSKDIQTGGAQGHDSKEDARAAGELVRLRISETWKRMRGEGWTLSGGEFNPPKPK